MDIKINPKDALNIIDQCIISGYKSKEDVFNEYIENKKTVSEELIRKWQELKNEWISKTLKELEKVFVSLPPLYNFKNSIPSAIVTAGYNYKYNGIANDFDAKLKKLNEYYKYIQTNFDVKPVQIDILGDQSRVNINSTDNSINTINNSIESNIEELLKIIEKNYKENDKTQIIQELNEIKELIKNKKSNKEKIISLLGSFLTRTSEIATAAPLIQKILENLLK